MSRVSEARQRLSIAESALEFARKQFQEADERLKHCHNERSIASHELANAMQAELRSGQCQNQK